MKQVMFMAPAIICAAVAFPALVQLAREGHKWPQALLCAFLPGCFLLLAGLLIRMNRDISRLRRRLARLEGKVAPGLAPHDAPDTSKLGREDAATPPGAASPPS